MVIQNTNTFKMVLRKCHRLLQKGFEVGLQFTARTEQGNINYEQWFIMSDDLVWWDTSVPQYRPVNFGFNCSPVHRSGVWKAHERHDPIDWILNGLDDEENLVGHIRVCARVLDTDIIIENPPPCCDADNIDSFLAFKERHFQLEEFREPELQTLQDIALSHLNPAQLNDYVMDLSKWKKTWFTAFRV